MNEQYKARFEYASTLAEDPVAAERLEPLLDILDFDTITNIADIGCRFLEQATEFSYIFPNANVYGFEPVTSSFNRCIANRARLPADLKDRLHVYECALSHETKPLTFYPADDPAVSSKYKFIPGLNGSFFSKFWTQTETVVQGMRMDDWRKIHNVGPIQLLWVDVQGGELDVFRGAEETLKDVKAILTEVGVHSYYEGQSLKPEIDEYLASQGFRELEGSFALHFEYEGNVIYIKD
jgi:FkbM family methyltransferase